MLLMAINPNKSDKNSLWVRPSEWAQKRDIIKVEI